jgi:carbon-monoxide dehydrogenase medium subunit
MIPAPFEYAAPTTIPDALSLLRRHGDDAKVLAGGHSLIPVMKLRLAAPAFLVDINRIDGLSYIREDGAFLRIGALTREAELERSELIARRYPVLADASRVIADPLVRNMATVGGNLAHADPANDHPAVMLALDAQLAAAGPSGERVIPIADFFVDAFVTEAGAQSWRLRHRRRGRPSHPGCDRRRRARGHRPDQRRSPTDAGPRGGSGPRRPEPG